MEIKVYYICIYTHTVMFRSSLVSNIGTGFTRLACEVSDEVN